MLALVGFVGLCLLVAAADSSLFAGIPRGWYLSLHRPPGTPPDWVFAPVWAGLYTVVGVAAWLVWRRTTSPRPLRLWGWQLAANAAWMPAFFALQSPPLAFGVNVTLLVLIALTVREFAAHQRMAGWLMAPYLVWTAYATWLTAGFWWLNPN